MAPKTSLTVGEVARRSGVAVSTIHFYESKGLIEGWRSEGNQRRYARSVLRRVAVIRIGQQAGIGLAVIKGFFETFPADKAITKAEWDVLIGSWRGMLDERITRLLQLRDQLGNCIGCGCLSLEDCPLRNSEDYLGQVGPGARILIAQD